MRVALLATLALFGGTTDADAQEMLKVTQGDARAVSRPDDLFKHSPGQWHVAKHLWEAAAPCTPDQCEAGITSGDMVVSAEHSGEFVRIIAGFRGCDPVASSEVEVGKKPGRSTFSRVRDQLKLVVKGISKTCKIAAPVLPPLDVARLFPAGAT